MNKFFTLSFLTLFLLSFADKDHYFKNEGKLGCPLLRCLKYNKVNCRFPETKSFVGFNNEVCESCEICWDFNYSYADGKLTSNHFGEVY